MRQVEGVLMSTHEAAPARIIDCNCMFGVWPRASLDASLPTVLDMLKGARITAAILGSLRAALQDSHSGNQEAKAACAEQKNLAPAAGLCLRQAVRIHDEVAAIKSAGFRLVRLFREYEGWPMDYAPLGLTLQAAAEHGLPVMLAAREPGEITALGRVIARAPCNAIVTGVNVSDTPLLTEAVAVGRDHASLFFETSRLEGIDSLSLMVAELGAGNLVFGTGMPFQYPSSAVQLVDDSGLPDGDRAAIFGENLLRLIGG